MEMRLDGESEKVDNVCVVIRQWMSKTYSGNRRLGAVLNARQLRVDVTTKQTRLKLTHTEHHNYISRQSPQHITSVSVCVTVADTEEAVVLWLSEQSDVLHTTSVKR